MEENLIDFSNYLIPICNSLKALQLASLIKEDQIKFINKEIDEKKFKTHLKLALECVEMQIEVFKNILDM